MCDDGALCGLMETQTRKASTTTIIMMIMQSFPSQTKSRKAWLEQVEAQALWLRTGRTQREAVYKEHQNKL